MKAKKKPIQKLTPADLKIDLAPRLETLKVTEPPKRQGGGRVSFPEIPYAEPYLTPSGLRWTTLSS